ncbi:hypothetical protein D3C81_1012180 [compost metagenome]
MAALPVTLASAMESVLAASALRFPPLVSCCTSSVLPEDSAIEAPEDSVRAASAAPDVASSEPRADSVSIVVLPTLDSVALPPTVPLPKARSPPTVADRSPSPLKVVTDVLPPLIRLLLPTTSSEMAVRSAPASTASA